MITDFFQGVVLKGRSPGLDHITGQVDDPIADHTDVMDRDVLRIGTFRNLGDHTLDRSSFIDSQELNGVALVPAAFEITTFHKGTGPFPVFEWVNDAVPHFFRRCINDDVEV